MSVSVSSSEDVRAFIKQYVAVDPAFVDDFFGLCDMHTTPNDFTVDLEVAAKWLRTTKGNLKRTLTRTYVRGVDYTLTRPYSGRKGVGSGVAKKETVLLTPDCFKAVCMMSRTAKAKEVRSYYIAAEKSLVRYREAIVLRMGERIKQLENNQKGALSRPQRRGIIYVIRASEKVPSLYKIGRTVSAHHRMRSHNRALADDLQVVVEYETDCVEAVEACMKRMLRPLQYRKRKEVYEIDLQALKRVLSSCNSACNAVYRARGDRRLTGGAYYAVVLPGDA